MGHLWIVELTHIYIFAFKFTLRYQQPDILLFATGVKDTGGKFAAGVVDTGGNLFGGKLVVWQETATHTPTHSDG